MGKQSIENEGFSRQAEIESDLGYRRDVVVGSGKPEKNGDDLDH